MTPGPARARGRPALRESLAGVRHVQRAIRHDLWVRSSITGRPLRRLAQAYALWFLSQERGWALGEREPPALDDPSKLAMARAQSIKSVRWELVKRARKHLTEAQAGSSVLALRMTPSHMVGPRVVPAIGWSGLPGLYSSQWPTPIGLHGEATVGEAHEAVARGHFELVELGVDEMRAVVKRFRQKAPDDAAVAESVAAAYLETETRPASAKKALGRLLREAQEYEYWHPGSEALTERKPLPRTYG